jgi:deoxyribonuclease-4
VSIELNATAAQGVERNNATSLKKRYRNQSDIFRPTIVRNKAKKALRDASCPNGVCFIILFGQQKGASHSEHRTFLSQETLMRLGVHVSIAGGVDLAIERGVALKCDAIQIFNKNNNQWKAFELKDEVVARYFANLRSSNLHPIVSHASYLINLATSDQALWEKSRDSFQEELERCDRLAIPYLVVHPGSHMGAGEEFGCARVAQALNEIYARKKIKCVTCIEHTAGQGNHIGYTFEHLAEIRKRLQKPRKVAFCLDTCHLSAAGYDFSTPEKYAAMMDAFDQIVGLKNLRVVHFNDSKTPLGSRVDRHEHIGKGTIGKSGFRSFLIDARLAEIPGLLETPTDGTGKDEKRNLNMLRRFAAQDPL